MAFSRVILKPIKDEPFVFKNVDGDGKEKWYGFSIDLLERMAEQIGFDYELIGLFCFNLHANVISSILDA